MNKIIKPLLLTVLATLTLHGLTAQQLPYKATLEHTLLPAQAITTAGDITPTTTFTPIGDFTLDLGLLMRPSHKGTLHLTAANGAYLGFNADITSDNIVFHTENVDSEGKPTVYPLNNDNKEHTYRMVLQGEKIHFYAGTTLLGTHAADRFDRMMTDPFTSPDDKESQTGIYDKRNLIRNPGFETEDVVLKSDASDYRFWPAEWEITNANAKDKQQTGVRCNKDNAIYANGREGSSALMFRQDGAGGFTTAAGSYIYQQLATPLKAGRRYKLSFQALSHTNDLGKTYAVAVGSARGTWDNLYTTWTAPSAKQTIQEYEYEFIATKQNATYIAFVCYGGSGIVHLDRITLVEEEGRYNTFHLYTSATNGAIDLDITGASYSEGSFSPIRHISNTLYDGGEYYLYNTYYSRLLGLNNSDIPALGTADGAANNVAYTWCAEQSEKQGYYRLRHKTTGKYLAASTTNTWSMTLNASKATNNTDLWAITEGTAGTITSLYSSKLLGTDSGQEANEHIGVYYDKPQSERTVWQLVEAQFALDESRLTLYLSELQEAIDLGKQIASSGIYGIAASANLQTTIEKAQTLANTATIDDITLIVATIADIGAAIDECKESSSEDNGTISIWATYDNNGVNLGSSHTLSLDSVTFANDATAYILIRNKEKQGALVGINRTSISIGGQTIATLPANNKKNSYLFSTDNGTLHIYHNGKLAGSAPTYTVPSLTTGEEKTEFTGLATQHLSSYIAEIISPDRALTPGEYDGNKYNKVKRQIALAYHCDLTLDKPADYFLLNGASTLEEAKLHIASESSWVILPHTRPSASISSLTNIATIKGEAPQSGKNYRAAIYLDGTAIIPYPADIQPFTLYSGELYSGEATSYPAGKHNALGDKANTIQSFILKRGYMATLAANADGSGYSRVFVADHEDLMVPVAPEALNRRVSSIIVKPWQYVSKKGWGSTAGNSTINKHTETIRANWFYTWSADRNNTTDLEYVPIKQHIWWPGWAQINALQNCTHVLGYNEPEHSEQHGSAQCSCGGAISEWSAFTHHTEFFESGMRIGSPSPTDAGWLKNYVQYCHNYAYRCDFVVTHAYWKEDIATWKKRLEDIHNATGRPIWITEMENGASWDNPSETNVNDAAKKYQQIFDLLESLDYVERYVPYNNDLWYNKMIYDDGWPTPAGFIFRDYPSSFAYKAEEQYIPDWWKPSLQAITMEASYDKNKLNFSINNPNCDVTDMLTIEYSYDGTIWETLYEESARWKFDNTDYNITIDATAFKNAPVRFRLHITTLIGGEKYSEELIPEVEVTMSISDAKYATFIAPFDIDIPAGVKASKIVGVDGNVLIEEPIENSIPANTPVILYSENIVNETFWGQSLATANSYTAGYLTGVYTPTEVATGNYVLLRKKDTGHIGFYLVNETLPTIKANTCYLTVPASDATMYSFSRDKDATSINHNPSADDNLPIYDLAGRRVEKIDKGIYIINNKITIRK